VLLLALPCAVALLIFPQPLVAVLFHYGAFSARDVQQTVRALMGYGVGLLGLIAIKVLAPGFFARQDIRTPVKIAIGVLVATQLMNLVLVPWLGHAGLALSIGSAPWSTPASCWRACCAAGLSAAAGLGLAFAAGAAGDAVLGWACLAAGRSTGWRCRQRWLPARAAWLAGAGCRGAAVLRRAAGGMRPAAAAVRARG
jgi:putative peptidoglycan lipid II flippase